MAENIPGHERFEVLAERLTSPPLGARAWAGGNLSRPLVGEVLSRVAVNTPPMATRASIARGDMLQVPLELADGSVSKAVSSLIVRELLEEVEPSPEVDVNAQGRGAGRPARWVQLHQGRWFTIGVHVDLSDDQHAQLTAVASTIDDTPIAGPVTARVRPGAPDTDDPDNPAFTSPVEAMTHLAAVLLETGAVQDRRVPRPGAEQEQGHQDSGSGSSWLPWMGLGVAIGSPVYTSGAVARHAGASNEVTSLQEWNSLGKRLVEALNVPVVVENDATALAVRETYGTNAVNRDFALILVADHGIGAAFAAHGQVYRGGRGLAGEVGHIEITPPHLTIPRPATGKAFAGTCWCGHATSAIPVNASSGETDYAATGHVDVFAVPDRLADHLKLDDLTDDTLAALTPERRDEARALYATAGHALGQGINALTNIVNPNELIIVLPTALDPHERDHLDPEVFSIKRAYWDGMEAALGQSLGRHLTPPHHLLVPMTSHVWSGHELSQRLARAAAVRVFIEFLNHLSGIDDCIPGKDRHGLSPVISAHLAGLLGPAAIGALAGGAIGAAYDARKGSRREQVLAAHREVVQPPPGPPLGRRLGDDADLDLAPW